MPERSLYNRPNITDRTAMFLMQPDTVHGTNLALVSSVMVGMVSGFAAEYYGVDGLFITNHQYQSQMSGITQLENTRSEYENAAKTLQKQGNPIKTSIEQAKVNSYTATIAHDKSLLPQGYEPHVEGLVDLGTFALTSIFVGGAIYKSIKHYAQRGEKGQAAVAVSPRYQMRKRTHHYYR